MKIAYNAQVQIWLGQAPVGPDNKHNTGNLLGQLFMWSYVEKYAKKQKESLWTQAEKEKIISDPRGLVEGTHELASSPHFKATARVSKPVEKLDLDALAQALNRKFKVPTSVFKDMAERAKRPTKSTVTKTVEEI